MKKATTSFLLAILLAVPFSVGAVATLDPGSGSRGFAADFSACGTIETEGLKGLVNCAIGFFNAAIYILVALSVVYTMIGAFQMIQSEEKRDSGRQRMIYGIIGLFVMVSIWGFVNILANTFGLAGSDPLSAPRLKNI